MAIQLGSAYGKVSLDSSGVKSGVDSATKSLGSLDKTAQKLGTTLQNVGKVMTASLTIPLALMAKEAVMMASSYSESLNKINVVFEGNAKVIEKWSLDAAKNLGLSQQAALEAAGTYGNLFTAQGMGTEAAADMSMALVQLAADLASFNNASPDEVLLALRSGLSGEIEPLKKFGIAMNEATMKAKAMELGLGDNIQALSEAEKIQVRYAIIMDQTAKAQGDFARTSEGLANQLRILKGNWGDTLKILGENLVPIVEKVLVQLNKWLEWFNNADPKTQKFIATLLLIVFVAGPLLVVFGKLLPMAFSGATKSMNPFSGGIFGLIGTIVKVIGFIATAVKVLGFFGVSTGTVGAGFVTLSTIISGTVSGITTMIFSFLGSLLLLATGPLILYLAFKYNFMGITDTAKQLWFILKTGFSQLWPWLKKSADEGLADIKNSFTEISIAFYDLVESIRKDGYAFTAVYEDGSGALLDLATAFGLPKKAVQDFLSALWLVFSPMSDAKLLFEDGSGALHNLAVAFGFPTQAAQDFLSALWLVFSSMSDARLLFEDGSGALLNLAVAFGIPEKKAQEFLSHVFFVASGFIKLFKGDMLGAVQDFAVGLFDITNPQLENLIQRFMDAVSRIIETFRNVDWAAVGMNIITTIANGIVNAIPNLINAALQAAQSAWDAAQSVFSGSSSSSAASPSSASPNDIARSMVKPASNISSSQKQTINMQFGDGLTMRQVQDMIAVNEEMLLKRLNSVLGGI